MGYGNSLRENRQWRGKTATPAVHQPSTIRGEQEQSEQPYDVLHSTPYWIPFKIHALSARLSLTSLFTCERHTRRHGKKWRGRMGQGGDMNKRRHRNQGNAQHQGRALKEGKGGKLRRGRLWITDSHRGQRACNNNAGPLQQYSRATERAARRS